MKCSNGMTSLDKLYLSRNVFHLISLPVVFNVNKKHCLCLSMYLLLIPPFKLIT